MRIPFVPLHRLADDPDTGIGVVLLIVAIFVIVFVATAYLLDHK